MKYSLQWYRMRASWSHHRWSGASHVGPRWLRGDGVDDGQYLGIKDGEVVIAVDLAMQVEQQLCPRWWREWGTTRKLRQVLRCLIVHRNRTLVFTPRLLSATSLFAPALYEIILWSWKQNQPDMGAWVLQNSRLSLFFVDMFYTFESFPRHLLYIDLDS